MLLLYAPIAVLVAFSFNASRLSATWQGLTLDWYRLLLEDEALRLAVRNSLVVGSASTVIATALGLCAAVGLARRMFRGQPLVEGAMLLPLVIPEIMMGVSLMLFFLLVRLPLGLLTVMIGHAVFNLPIVTVILRARLRKLDPSLEEAARDLWATPWQAFRRVTPTINALSAILVLISMALIGASLALQRR
ncbi:MAG: ABC transporter permease [Nitrospiraceae bacterium]